MTTPVVTIDGPNGVGKTAVARALAGVLGWRWVSAGLLYRAIVVAGDDVSVDFEPGPDGIADPLIRAGEARYRESDLHGDDLAAKASRLAQDPGVRSRVRAELRRVATSGVVLEGRSMMQTAPDAVLHLYLWADRAARESRTAAIGQRWDPGRDRADRHREHEPVRVRPGMTVWNSTRYAMSETVRYLARRVALALGEPENVVALAHPDDGAARRSLSVLEVPVLRPDDTEAAQSADFVLAVPAGARPDRNWVDAHLRVLRAGNDLVTVGPPVGMGRVPADRNLTGAPHRQLLASHGNVGLTADLWHGAVPTDGWLSRLPDDARWIFVPEAILAVRACDLVHFRDPAARDDLLMRLQDENVPDDRVVVVVDHVGDPVLPLLVEAARPGRRARVVDAGYIDVDWSAPS